MTHDEAVSKAVRLLRLAKSDNPHEAALAAAKAQEIIDRYQLGMLGLDATSDEATKEPDEPIMDLGAAPLDAKSDAWRTRLAIAVANANQCRVILRNGIVLIGRPSDAETVRYIYAVLAQEVERISDRDGKGLGRTWRNNFRLGMVETISHRLQAQRAETEQALRREAQEQSAIPQERALARVASAIEKREAKGVAVDTWIKANLKLRTVSLGRGAYHNNDARAAGRRAGHEVAIRGRSAGALGSGQ